MEQYYRVEKFQLQFDKNRYAYKILDFSDNLIAFYQFEQPTLDLCFALNKARSERLQEEKRLM